ncbi:carbohydrate-binding protein [Wenyingzhuangia sp. IMCC45574]
MFGPYKFRGAVEAHGDHGTYFTWHNQTYYIAGGWAKPYFRYTYLTYAHYKDNGEIVAERVFNGDKEEQGVARYNCSLGAIEAENFFAASDELVKKESNTGFEMRNIQNNSYLFFPKLYNALRKATIEFKVASAHKKGGIIEVRQGSTKGKLLASCKIKSTGSWDNYQTFSCDLKNKSSLLDLYFVFKGDSLKEIMRLDSFSVSAKPMVYKPTLTFNDTNNYTFKTFTTDDTLTITCKYHAGTGNKVKGTGVEFFLREFSNRKVVKTHKLSDASTINTQTGIAKVHFNLTEVTPSKELNSRNKYQLMAVLKTSNGKTISQGLRAEIEVVKK